MGTMRRWRVAGVMLAGVLAGLAGGCAEQGRPAGSAGGYGNRGTAGVAGRVPAATRPAETAGASAEHAPTMSPDAALAKLVEGNRRFVAGAMAHPAQGVERRQEVAKGQHPFAVVLSCSDSRVPPEVVFDTGLGDLFIVRVAGNTADDAAIGSIEYAVEHLGASLIVVLGHERCGAVKAAVETMKAGGEAPGHLPAVVNPIRPAVLDVQGQSGDPVELAAQANVTRVVSKLKVSQPVLADRVAKGSLKIVGGKYDLDTGVVEFK